MFIKEGVVMFVNGIDVVMGCYKDGLEVGVGNVKYGVEDDFEVGVVDGF